MDRKEFLKKGMGVFSILPVLLSCTRENILSEETGNESGSTNGSSSSDCTVTHSETEGPYPIKSPGNVAYPDIRGGREGVSMWMEIVIKNVTTGCQPLENITVDAWQCDALGNYSQYGSFTSANWLRGRQSTNAEGKAGFHTIFPGWYRGRAPHIHVHVYSESGKSLLVTQIAFPKSVCDDVYTRASPYKDRGVQDTTNERDDIFRDSLTTEMGTITGSISNGYTLQHTIVVRP